MENYSVKILETSKELTAREKIKLKDTSMSIKLDEVVTPETPLILKPDGYAVLGIHNEKSENKDYEVYVITSPDGNTYVTGSTSFYSSFKEIFDEMKNESEEYEIEVHKLESKNYKGKYFLTCTIV